VGRPAGEVAPESAEESAEIARSRETVHRREDGPARLLRASDQESLEAVPTVSVEQPMEVGAMLEVLARIESGFRKVV
jgi:hypothetical protein